MKTHRRTTPPPPRERDENPTAFTRILERLLELEPAVLGAVLVDNEGEAVDYAGGLTTFYTKVAGAYLRIALDQISSSDPFPSGTTPSRMTLGRPTQLLVRCVRRSFVVRALPDGYALVMVLKRQRFDISRRALTIVERELFEEAEWPLPAQKGPVWHPVQVETSWRDRRRPLRLLAGSTWQRVEVLGSVVGLGRERGYRCHVRSLAEFTLVREPAGVWYADEPIDAIAGGTSPARSRR